MFDWFDRNGHLMDPQIYSGLHPLWALFWGLVSIPVVLVFWIYPIKMLQAGIIYCVLRIGGKSK